MQIDSKKVKQIMKEKGITVSEIAKSMGVKRQTAQYRLWWARKEETIAMVARELGVGRGEIIKSRPAK